jgi:hypothetical protein
VKKSKYIFVLFLVLSFSSLLKATTYVSAGNGSWTNASTWIPNGIPACEDSIVILAAHTVSVLTQLDYTSCTKFRLTIYGLLKFQTGNKLKLPCDAAIYVMPGGSIDPGGGGGNSNTIEICNDIYWNAAAGTYTGPGCMPATQPGCSAVLPIELSLFSGTLCNSNKVCLKWETASEKNNKYFDVQRSNDISSFQSLVKINSKAVNGYSGAKLSYEYVDDDPIDGVSYYRLMQVDNNNGFSFSKLVAVDFIKEKNIKFVVYPNPNSGEFTADISGLDNNHEVKVMLRDLNGSLLFESSFFTNDQSKNIQIVPMSKLKSGIYICSLYLEEIEYKVKVIVNSAG